MRQLWRNVDETLLALGVPLSACDIRSTNRSRLVGSRAFGHRSELPDRVQVDRALIRSIGRTT